MSVYIIGFSIPPHMIGIVSLESDSGQYGIKILSRHISNKIELLESDDAMHF